MCVAAFGAALAALGLPSLIHTGCELRRGEPVSTRASLMSGSASLSVITLLAIRESGAIRQAALVGAAGVLIQTLVATMLLPRWASARRARAPGAVVRNGVSPRSASPWFVIAAVVTVVAACVGVTRLTGVSWADFMARPLELMLLALFIVFAWQGRLETALTMALPGLLTVLVLLGVWGWCSASVDSSATAALLVLALLLLDVSIRSGDGVLRRERNLASRPPPVMRLVGAAVVAAAVALVAARVAGSDAVPLLPTAVGLLVAIVATVVLVPALLRKVVVVSPGAARGWQRDVARRYRYVGPAIGHYATSKVKRDPLVEALPSLCSGGGDLLVVGCGYGVMTVRLALADPNRRICALDVDERKVWRVQAVLRDCPAVSVECADILEWPQRSELFGTALLVDVLHYWPHDSQRAILASVVQQLSSGGRLVFRDGCSTGDSRERRITAGETLAKSVGFTRRFGRFHFRTEEDWRSLLNELGLQVESVRPDLGAQANTVMIAKKGE